MKKYFIILLFSVALSAQEAVNLTVPETVPALSQVRIGRIIITPDNPATVGSDEGEIYIEMVGVQREDVNPCRYNSLTTPTATTLIVGLNKANLSSAYNNNATTGSLNQRINHRLVIMNEDEVVCQKPINGTLTGTVP